MRQKGAILNGVIRTQQAMQATKINDYVLITGASQGLGRAFAEEFAKRFGRGAGPAFSVAPGRVNIIGEHTDYTGGPVMPLAIDMCVEIGGWLHVDGAYGLIYCLLPDW